LIIKKKNDRDVVDLCKDENSLEKSIKEFELQHKIQNNPIYKTPKKGTNEIGEPGSDISFGEASDISRSLSNLGNPVVDISINTPVVDVSKVQNLGNPRNTPILDLSKVLFSDKKSIFSNPNTKISELSKSIFSNLSPAKEVQIHASDLFKSRHKMGVSKMDQVIERARRMINQRVDLLDDEEMTDVTHDKKKVSEKFTVIEIPSTSCKKVNQI
jgi:hypothetical protein